MREFLHVDDLADACALLMHNCDAHSHINFGTGDDLSIRSLAELISAVVYPEGERAFDTTKPDGTPSKVLDVSRLNALGWKATKELPSGIADTYARFLSRM